MRKRKIYSLLKLLNPEKRARLTAYLDSPYHNTSRTLRKFWQQWQEKVLSQPEDVAVTEAEFVAGTKLKISRIDALCWELTVAVRKFWAVEKLAESPMLEAVLFGKAVLDSGGGTPVTQRFLPQLVQELERQPASPEQSLAIFYARLQLLESRINERISDEDWIGHFARANVHLENFTQATQLRIGAAAANIAAIYRQADTDPETAFYRSFLDHAPAEAPTVLIALYRNILEMILHPSQAATFRESIRLLDANGNRIQPMLCHEIYSYLLNFAIQQLNRGATDFLHPVFELYRSLDRNDMVLVRGQVAPQRFKNIVSLAGRAGETKWAEKFIDKYVTYLPPERKALALRYSRGVLHFYQGNYRTAIAHFHAVIEAPVDDPFYGLDARLFLWKSFFEHREALSAEEVDEMYRLYDSFRLYISRHKTISESHRRNYRNLIRLFKRYLQYTYEPDLTRRKKGLQQLHRKLDDIQGFANKTWFHQRLEQELAQLDDP
ncbi:MAG: hypothetical protein AAF998_01620 [Bacteroidota bacterium]